MTKRLTTWWCTIALVVGSLLATPPALADEATAPGAETVVEAVVPEAPRPAEIDDGPRCVDGYRAQFTQTHSYGRQFGGTARVWECASGLPAAGNVVLALADSGGVLAESRLYNGNHTFIGVSAPRSESSFELDMRFDPADGSGSRSWPARITTSTSSVSLRLSTDVKAAGVVFDATVVTPRTVNLGALRTPNTATGTVVIRRGDDVLGTAELKPSPVYANETWARLTVQGLAVGEPVILEYLGDDGYPAASLTKALVDNRTRTDTTITAATVTATHAQIVAEVLDWTPGSSDLLVGQQVAISVDGRPASTVVVPANEVGSRSTEHGLRRRARVVHNFQVTPGTHEITVSFGGNDRLQPSSASTTLTASKVATSVSRPFASPSTVGSTRSTVLSSTVLDSTGQPIGVQIAFQERTVGSSTWRTVGTTTAKAGVAVLTTTPRVSRDYRAVVVGTSTYLTSTSSTSRVTVARTASLARIAHPSTPRTAAILVTRVAPTGKVLLQERQPNGSWVTRVTRTASGATGSTSEVRFTVSRTTTNRVFRVLVPADAAATQAVSPTVTVPRR
ncbi:hypothetical protein [Cellulosimicrobium sp. CUA-896]|uniref:hypothetical protein n=1 Tax=Cellulosimicrobium sp. CUA-896 TaxID=1517881 RepID=UPI000961E4AC|nr:hypothetical protein [Cellulosimicrobium sp. CUA-896]OLT54626.1 hypothetical protein BJF88_07900 [Cellulosimicrobium sp. CUA-896]